MKEKLIWIFLFIIIIGLILLSVSSFLFFRLKNEPELIYKPEKAIFDRSLDLEPESEKNLILVDLSGAVVNPGPYKFSDEVYLYELINLAGGFTESVDKEYLNKNLNLVDKINNNQKIYIPLKNDAVNIKNIDVGSVEGTLISINTAELDDLISLPGVGEVRAKEIIKNRPYQQIDDLIDKKIISTNLFSDIKKLISL